MKSGKLMYKMLRGLLLLLPLFAWCDRAHADQVLYLLRHAEKEISANRDPDLSAPGRERSEKLAHWFAETGVDAIYASEFRRTRATAEPLVKAKATRLRLARIGKQAIPEWATQFAKKLRRRHAGETVVVIGHSNTIPELARALGVEIMDIAENEYDRITRIEFRQGRVLVEGYRY
jgi:broad specificity phosphatase PhoE